MRLLEIEILKLQLKSQTVTDIGSYILLDVDKFYGIEYEEFPAQIAQVAMWLADHQMNMLAGQTFGDYYVRLPLRKSATIVHGNALRIDWQSLIEPQLFDLWVGKKTTQAAMQLESADKNILGSPAATETYSYILGNPPFIGKSLQNASQKEDMELIFNGVNGAGVLDYVTAWYIKAAQYMKSYEPGLVGTGSTKTAFVSTNSISQGEQVGILWNELFNSYKCKIHFAHRTFKWGNEAKGNAAVHVVIIGFANFDIAEKRIYEYEDIKGEPHEVRVKNINPYLIEGNDTFIPSRKKPICSVPEITYGSMANDGGSLLLSDEEKIEMVEKEPDSIKVIRSFLGSQEFINNIKRWCIWLKDVPPNEFSRLKEITKRIQIVKEYRLKSTRPATQKLADFPTLFGEIRQPETDYLLIPGVSSENRKYIPIGFLSVEIIASDLARTIPNADLFMFGIMTSLMHMTWVKYTCGRLKSDFRYSNSLVYNNYPWPENPTNKQKEVVEKTAQAVLDARLQFPNSSLADLYDPNTMPPVLIKAHQQLDKAVDLCYRPQPFINETKRIEFLFELYDKYVGGLFVKEKRGKRK